MNLNKISVAAFTGSRSEYGLLRHLLIKLREDPTINLQLIVSGSHLSSQYGYTIDEIKNDNFHPSALVPLSLDEKSIPSMAFLTAEAIKGVDKALELLNPEYLILLGDRYETFAAAIAGHLQQKCLIHLHGGESTYGAIDDRLRHSITQLSNWHFTAAEPYREKVINMGIEPQNVFQVGPMVIDGLIHAPIIKHNQFEEETGFRFGEKNLLVTYHPETLSKDLGIKGFQALLNGIRKNKCHVLFTKPNADTGGEIIQSLIEDFVDQSPKSSWKVDSLGQTRYIAALRLFEAMAGNSSSGLIEAPLIGLPVLNIGNRQRGRIRHGYVLDIPLDDQDAINQGLTKVLEKGYGPNKPRNLTLNQKSPSQEIWQWLKTHQNQIFK